MITSAKKYNNKKKDRQNPRTNGKSKAIQTKSHKREKGKYIYIYLKKERATKSINKSTKIISSKY